MTTKVRNLSLKTRDKKTVKALREDVSVAGWSALSDWYNEREQTDLATVWRWYAAILHPVLSVLRSPIATMDEWNRRKMLEPTRRFRALPGGAWRDGRGYAPAVVPRWLYGTWCPRQHEFSCWVRDSAGLNQRHGEIILRLPALRKPDGKGMAHLGMKTQLIASCLAGISPTCTGRIGRHNVLHRAFAPGASLPERSFRDGDFGTAWEPLYNLAALETSFALIGKEVY